MLGCVAARAGGGAGQGCSVHQREGVESLSPRWAAQGALVCPPRWVPVTPLQGHWAWMSGAAAPGRWRWEVAGQEEGMGAPRPPLPPAPWLALQPGGRRVELTAETQRLTTRTQRHLKNAPKLQVLPPPSNLAASLRLSMRGDLYLRVSPVPCAGAAAGCCRVARVRWCCLNFRRQPLPRMTANVRHVLLVPQDGKVQPEASAVRSSGSCRGPGR